MWERLSPWSGIQNKWKLRCATFYFITSAAIKAWTSGTISWQIDKTSGLEGKSSDLYKNVTQGIYWMKEQVLWAGTVHSPYQTSVGLIDACKHKQIVWTLLTKWTALSTLSALSHHNGLYYYYRQLLLLQINTYCGSSSKHWNVHQGWLFFFFFV